MFFNHYYEHNISHNCIHRFISVVLPSCVETRLLEVNRYQLDYFVTLETSSKCGRHRSKSRFTFQLPVTRTRSICVCHGGSERRIQAGSLRCIMAKIGASLTSESHLVEPSYASPRTHDAIMLARFGGGLPCRQAG